MKVILIGMIRYFTFTCHWYEGMFNLLLNSIAFLMNSFFLKDRHHLISLTKEQLKLLAETKYWYA